MFDTQSLRKAAETALADAHPLQLPPGKTGYLILAVDQDHAQLVAAMKVGDHWDISGQIGKAWKVKGVEAGVTIHGSF